MPPVLKLTVALCCRLFQQGDAVGIQRTNLALWQIDRVLQGEGRNTREMMLSDITVGARDIIMSLLKPKREHQMGIGQKWR